MNRFVISDLNKLQEELDTRIFTQHHLKREDTVQDRILAFAVELSEFANETRCFKYWSEKPASDKAVILEEYGDGLHFLLSLGLDFDVQLDAVEFEDSSDSLNQLLLKTYQCLAEFSNNTNKKTHYCMFQVFLQAGYKLGFTAEEIREYYLKKNVINHQRQDQHY